MYFKSPQLWGSYRESRYEMALPLTSCSFIAKLVFGPVCYTQAALISLLNTSCDFSCDVEVNLLPFDTQLASHSGQNFTNYQLFLEVCFIAIRFIYYSHLLLIFLCASVLKPTHWEMDVSQLEYTVFTCRLRESFEFNALIIWGGKFVSSYQVSGMFFPC